LAGAEHPTGNGQVLLIAGFGSPSAALRTARSASGIFAREGVASQLLQKDLSHLGKISRSLSEAEGSRKNAIAKKP
jgi:hypothetical protein